ncbi:MAG: TetR/AcrR family transcriptional regulator [Actinomycetota bacterium]
MTTDLSHPRDRILDAAYGVFEECGVQVGTMSDIAERARLGRATLYRYFPGKDLVVEAVVLREARRLLAILSEELGGSDDPGSLLERGLLRALRYLRAHTLLQRVLRDEPDSILPFLTLKSAPLIEAAVEFASPYIERAVKAERMAPVDPRVAAEWAARVLLSLLLTPSVTIDLDDPKELEAFVAGIGSLVGPQGGFP